MKSAIAGDDLDERDGYQAALKDMMDRQTDLESLEQSVEILKENIASVIIERDAYRDAANNLLARLNSQDSRT